MVTMGGFKFAVASQSFMMNMYIHVFIYVVCGGLFSIFMNLLILYNQSILYASL